MNTRRINIIGSILIIVLGITGWLSIKQLPEIPEAKPSVSEKQKDTVIVVKVVDGDTIEISGGQKVRLIGVNTPETVDPRRPVQCFGKEASDYTKSKLEGQEVRMEKDVSDTDRYGRLLRYIWLNNELFNETLVRDGYAQVDTVPPDVKYKEKFLEAQDEARNNNKGLWEKCGVVAF